MSDGSSSPPNGYPTGRRRASFSPGQTLSELFNRSTSNTAGTVSSTSPPGPITTAAANAQAQHRRRMSINTLGLSGTSPTQTAPFNVGRPREDSLSSVGSASSTLDENVIEEGDAPPGSGSPTATPFGRRLSFGARALRDVRSGGSGSYNGEGFNWSDSLRSRAERTSSMAAAAGANVSNSPPQPSHHQRAASVATMEQPVREMPKSSKVPDAFGERILKGDFYMD
ncbi:hypothetical protein L228DRAFT_21382 [Xylona heveae TC161]|uniref:Uncharacterized protein n=1 Tax=Xylona heveae (strain CBS 132557 / TC161) TaxID=1328760 RepID=A0A165K261_XYLHT|nr:hypothetical protein L228DRAFT_21382 [Xylona heveae TC161]KZF26902.1 hypothetical protein L228DRAFT_21382 [Xylona heveae TC161]